MCHVVIGCFSHVSWFSLVGLCHVTLFGIYLFIAPMFLLSLVEYCPVASVGEFKSSLFYFKAGLFKVK